MRPTGEWMDGWMENGLSQVSQVSQVPKGIQGIAYRLAWSGVEGNRGEVSVHYSTPSVVQYGTLRPLRGTKTKGACLRLQTQGGSRSKKLKGREEGRKAKALTQASHISFVIVDQCCYHYPTGHIHTQLPVPYAEPWLTFIIGG